jgi:hypothetical protein
VYNCGRADNEATTAKLRELAKNILSRVEPRDLVGDREDWTLVDAFPYGDVYVLEQLWARLGMRELLPQLSRDVVSKYVRADRSNGLHSSWWPIGRVRPAPSCTATSSGFGRTCSSKARRS